MLANWTPSAALVSLRRWLAVGALLTLAILAVVAPNAHADGAVPVAPSTKLDQRIEELAAVSPSQTATVITRFSPGVDPDAAKAIAAQYGATSYQALPIINGLALRIPVGQAKKLADNAGVEAVAKNHTIRTSGLLGDLGVLPGLIAPTFDASLDAPIAWNLGATGKGVGVAVLDTGIAPGLVDFNASPTDASSRVVASTAVNPAATTTTDLFGHGTHVAGIIAGNGANRGALDPLAGKYVGVAPGANLISVKADDDNGNATVLDVLNGLQWILDHKDAYNIRVANLSVESGSPESYTTDPMDAAVESLWFHGIAVVAAAGNRGADADAAQYAPGNDPYVITVGGTDESATAAAADDLIASWSSRGATQDGFAKPDVYAPGAHIVSTLAPGSYFSTACLTCIVSGSYFQISGSSMAAPMVAGLVATMLELHPTWTPDQVKAALLTTVRSGGADASIPEASGSAAGADGTAVANVGLTPNSQANLGPTTAPVDPTRSTWSRSTWSRSTWSRSTWSRSTWSRSTWSSLAP